MTKRFAKITEPQIRAQRRLNKDAIRVFEAVALHADSEGSAFPGMATLASIAGIERKNIPRELKRLETEGFLRRLEGPPGRLTNTYLINPDPERSVTSPERTLVDIEMSSPVRTPVLSNEDTTVLYSEDTTVRGSW